jgi:predicted RNA-binding protein Jag
MYTNIRKINLEASSIEDAIRRVAIELEVPESCLQAKIISEGKGFLGIFGKKLQLEITVNPENTETEITDGKSDSDARPKKQAENAGKKSKSDVKQEKPNENTGKKSKSDANQEKPTEITEKKGKSDVKQERPTQNIEKKSNDVKQEKTTEITENKSKTDVKQENPVEQDNNPDYNAEARLELINESKKFIDELIDKMGLNVVAQVTENNFISMDGEDAAIVVGKYGDTLKAIEYIINLCVRETKDIPRIKLDSDGYRDRRASNLQRLAVSMAKKAAVRGIPIKLEPMASWERRIIHLTLQDSPDVFTESIGEPPERKVVIMPKVNHNEVRARPRRRSRR